MSLQKKFEELDKPKQGEVVDKGQFGKKGYYGEKEAVQELGKTGHYTKVEFNLPPVLKENPAIIFILLLAIGALGYFVFLYTPTTVTSSFNVVVLSGEAKLAGAAVTVYDGSRLLASTTTDSTGTATFSGLPAKPLRFSVESPNGRIEKLINPFGRQTYSLNLQGSFVASDSITLTVLDSTNQQPVQGVKLAYSLGSNLSRNFVETDSTGKAVIDLFGETIIRIRVVDPQRRYVSQSLTLLASREIQPILLTPVSGSTELQPSAAEQTAAITVLVRDENGEPVQSGQVTAFYTFTGSQAGEAEVQNGEALISGLTLNSFVSFSVQSPGFYPSQSAEVAVTSESQPVLVALQRVPESAPKTTITAISDGVSVEGTVYVFESGNLTQLVSNILTNGAAEFTLPESSYYALVLSQGYLPGISREFTSGENIEVPLLPASEETAASLEVNVVDEDNSGVANAAVVALNEDGRLLALPVITEFGGTANFVLPLNSRITVRASLEPLQTSKEVELTGNTAVSLTLPSHAAFLRLNVANVVDNSPVDATLTSYYNGALYNQCTGLGGCIVAVRSESDVAVSVDAAGFLPYTYYGEQIAQLATQEAEVKLIPASVANGINAELLEVVDENGNVVSGNVLSSGKYIANFFVSSPSAEQLSLYIRVGDGKQNSSLTSVYLLEPLSVDAVDVAKSAVFLTSQPQCLDLAEPVFEPPYKWVELTFTNTLSQQVAIPFVVPQGVEGPQFSLEFRAKAVNGEAHSRFPVDNELGFSSASPQKANCYADTTKVEFTLSSGRAPTVENVFPVIDAEFTAGDAIVFDPTNRRLKSQNNLAKYTLQVDSILPADAMPLTLQRDSQCTVLVKQPNTTSRIPSSSCYRYDEAKNMLVFETRELNAACPIYLQEDKFYSANNTRITTDSAVLSVSASCAVEAKVDIPIEVNLVSGVTSLVVKPPASELGEGDAAKLIYLINNRQIQRRNIEATFDSVNSYQLQGASAKAIAWRGPGTLEITEENALLEEIIIENQSTHFKPGIGILSHRQTSCAANDVYCCANGWCTRKALEEFLPTFRETSQRVGQSTAFRRGSGQPWNYFSQSAFKFVTVVQASQGSQSALSVEGVNFSSPVSCSSGNPGVYELSAASGTGNEDAWNYSAKTLELRQADYIQRPSNCGASSNATQVSLTSADGSVALCNFLSPKNNCIESTRNASILSIDQVETLEFEFTNCMYPVFPSAPVCPGTKMVLPAVNILNYRSQINFDPTDSPNAFKKLWTAISNSNRSSFSVFSWQGQLKCLVPPSFQQFGISAAAAGISQVPDYGEEEAKSQAPSVIRSDVCSRQDFFNLGVIPNYDTLIPLAGVCCPTGLTAQICTPRKGKFFVSVKDNKVKITTQWGLTESCLPYWPFPTSIRGLIQPHNLVSVGFGLAEFLHSNGANFEMSLASEVPGEKPAAASAAGLSSKTCNSDSDCVEYEQCAVDRTYSYKGSNGGGKCTGASNGVPGVCTYTSVTQKQVCTGGTQCKQDGSTARCNECGNGENQQCCVSNGNAFCTNNAYGCKVESSGRHYCTSQCGGKDQPVCGWDPPSCRAGEEAIRPPNEAENIYYSYCAE